MRGRKRKRSLLTQKTNNCCLSSSSRRLDVASVLRGGGGKCWWGDEEMKWPLKKTVRQLDRWWHWRASQLKLLLLWWLLWLLKLKLLKLKTQLMRRRRRHLYLSKNQDLDLMVIKTHTHTHTHSHLKTGQDRTTERQLATLCAVLIWWCSSGERVSERVQTSSKKVVFGEWVSQFFVSLLLLKLLCSSHASVERRRALPNTETTAKIQCWSWSCGCCCCWWH